MMFNFKRILSLFFPSRCPFCNEIISVDEVVCEICRKDINFKSHKSVVQTRQRREFISVSPFLYEEPIRAAIHNYKFNGVKSFCASFGFYITEALKENIDISKIDCITSVPLHLSRKRERGFNQSETFAREISKLTGVPYVELLKKVKKNKIQHELSLAERTENVKGVYDVVDEALIAGKTVLLCDDILTTGNTMGECANMLFNAGAKEVIGATIARVRDKIYMGATKINT